MAWKCGLPPPPPPPLNSRARSGLPCGRLWGFHFATKLCILSTSSSMILASVRSLLIVPRHACGLRIGWIACPSQLSSGGSAALAWGSAVRGVSARIGASATFWLLLPHPSLPRLLPRASSSSVPVLPGSHRPPPPPPRINHASTNAAVAHRDARAYALDCGSSDRAHACVLALNRPASCVALPICFSAATSVPP